VALFGAAWAFSRLVTPVGSTREIWLVSLYSQIGDPRVLQRHAPAVAGVVAVVAFGEELVWRGTVTQLLAERVGSRSAWAWSAALYALAYVPTMWALRANAGIDPVLVIAALGGGLLWGAMARAFGRLAPSILAHALFDWAVLMMFPLWGPGAHG
jgi:membrane protease YdiL (CAAX protease family)